MSAVLGVQRELTEALKQGMEFQKQVMTLTQENAELRVQAERHLSRIRDLERENAEIPVLKARIAELELELSERPKLPKTVPVDVSAKVSRRRHTVQERIRLWFPVLVLVFLV